MGTGPGTDIIRRLDGDGVLPVDGTWSWTGVVDEDWSTRVDEDGMDYSDWVGVYTGLVG